MGSHCLGEFQSGMETWHRHMNKSISVIIYSWSDEWISKWPQTHNNSYFVRLWPLNLGWADAVCCVLHLPRKSFVTQHMASWLACTHESHGLTYCMDSLITCTHALYKLIDTIGFFSQCVVVCCCWKSVQEEHKVFRVDGVTTTSFWDSVRCRAFFYTSCYSLI